MTPEKKISGAKLLRTIAEQMHEYVRGLSDLELAALRKTSKRMTTANCDWLVYTASLSLTKLGDEEKRYRSVRQAPRYELPEVYSCSFCEDKFVELPALMSHNKSAHDGARAE